MSAKRRPAVSRVKRVGAPEEDTLDSDEIMQEVVAAVVKHVRVNRSYDVPYLGGSSRAGTIYIDRHLPKSFSTRGRRIAADPFIIIHEAIERVVGDRLRLHYQHAHQIALRVEEAAVRAEGISWHDYNAFMQKNVDRAGKHFTKLPPELDLKPYRDEGDQEMLKRIRQVLRVRHPKR